MAEEVYFCISVWMNFLPYVPLLYFFFAPRPKMNLNVKMSGYEGNQPSTFVNSYTRSWSLQLASLLWLKENHWLRRSADWVSPAAILCSLAVSCFLPAFVSSRGEGDGQMITAKEHERKSRMELHMGGGSFSLVPVTQSVCMKFSIMTQNDIIVKHF